MAGSLPQSGVSLVAQNAGQFLSSMRSAEGALGSFQRSTGAMSQIVTGAFRQIGTIITNVLAGAVRAVGGWLKASVGVAGDFEQTLNVLGATSGATAAELDQVAAKAKALGADLTLPATSAQDAAEVMLELSKAGFSVQESMDAAKGALQLSAAAQVDAATAAQITAGAINAFNLEASDAVRIADLLAAGANASSASMTDLAQGLQQAGFMFHAVGMPVEDLVTSLAALTNVGLTGSDAGTALKNALVRLSNPTKKAAELMDKLGFTAYDANGKMKPMPLLITDLQKALTGMTDEQRNAALGTIFLSDGMKAMIPLLGLGADGFNDLKSKVTVAGSAADVAGAQMKGWNGAVASAKSQMETLQLIIGTVLKKALTPLLFRIADIIAKIVVFADRFTSAQGGLARFGSAIQGIITAFNMGSDGAALMGLALGNLRKLIGPLAPLVAGLVTGFIRVQEITTKAASALRGIIVAFQTGSDAAGLMRLSVNNLLMAFGLTEQQATIVQGAFSAITGAVLAFAGQVQAAFAEGGISGVIGLFAGLIQGALGRIGETVRTVGPNIVAALPGIIASVGTIATGIITTIGEQLPGIIDGLTTWRAAFLNSITAKLPEIITGVGTTAANVITAIGGALPGIIAALSRWSFAFLDWLLQASPGLLGALVTTGLQIITAIGGALPGIIEALAAWGAQFVQWVIDALPKLFATLLDLNTQVLAWIVEKAPGILAKLAEWGAKFVLWVVETVPKLLVALGDMLAQLIRWVFDHRTEIATTLQKWGEAFVNWIGETAIPGILTALGELWSKLTAWISETAGKIGANDSVGSAIVNGIKQGINNAWEGLKKGFMDKINGLLASAKALLQAGSPSRVFADQVGKTIPQGIAQGITAQASAVQKSLSDLLNTAIAQAQSGAADMYGALTPGSATGKKGKKGKRKAPSKAAPPVAAPVPPRKALPALLPLLPQIVNEDMYHAIERLAREAAAKAAAAGAPRKLPSGPIRQTLNPTAPPALPVPAPATVRAPQTTTTTYQMPIYTNQSPAVLSQSLSLIEALTA